MLGVGEIAQQTAQTVADNSEAIGATEGLTGVGILALILKKLNDIYHLIIGRQK